MLTKLEEQIENNRLARSHILVMWKLMEKGEYLLTIKYLGENRVLNWTIKKAFNEMIDKIKKEIDPTTKVEFL